MLTCRKTSGIIISQLNDSAHMQQDRKRILTWNKENGSSVYCIFSTWQNQCEALHVNISECWGYPCIWSSHMFLNVSEICTCVQTPPHFKIFDATKFGRSRDSSVCIPVCYGLDGRVKLFLFTTSRLWEPTQHLIQWLLWTISPGVKLPEREADLRLVPRSRTVELYFHSLILHGVVLN
jgi:hypothetical protein